MVLLPLLLFVRLGTRARAVGVDNVAAREERHSQGWLLRGRLPHIASTVGRSSAMLVLLVLHRVVFLVLFLNVLVCIHLHLAFLLLSELFHRNLPFLANEL